MKCTKTQLGLFSAIALVALRVCVGWHFFSEGLSHYADPKWSSEGFLKQAKGPLADWYQKSIPDFHGWTKILLKPEEDDRAKKKLAAKISEIQGKAAKNDDAKANEKAPPEEKTPVGERAPRDEKAKAVEELAKKKEAAYKELIARDWVENAYKDWLTLKTNVADHYKFTDEQQKKANDLLAEYRGRLYESVAKHDEDIRAYRHEGWRLGEMQKSKSASEVPNQKKRIDGKQRDLTAEKGLPFDDNSNPAAWQSGAKIVEASYVEKLLSLANADQLKKGLFVEEPSSLKKQDRFVTYSLLAIGVCLMVGFLTPFAALGGVAFLTTIVAAQPFWVAGATPTFNQYVEIFALLFLAVSCAGKYAGLDYILSGLCCRCCRSSKGKSS